MFIGLCGGICAGKSSVAQFLIEEHGFKRLRLSRTVATPAEEKSASDTKLPLNEAKSLKDGLYFTHVDDLMNFVTKQWKERWVTTDIWDEDVLDALVRRPFFLLVSVDAPVSVRWDRFRQRCESYDLPAPSLADFVTRSDAHLYSPPTPLAPLLHQAQLRLLNSTPSISSLRSALRSLDLLDEGRLRPSWDAYFMQLASLAAQRSNCMKRRVGCVIVRDRRVISTGYNGTPRGLVNCNEGGCGRCNDGQQAGAGLDTCLCIHAEENALLEAGRERIREGATLYCDTCPCLTCSVKIANIGISEVVYSKSYSLDTTATKILRDASIRLRQYSPPMEGLVDLDAIEGGA